MNASGIQIVATFTADPVGPMLSAWLRELGYCDAIRFAAYQQVFQTLLGTPVPPEFTTMVLVRLEDWRRGSAIARELSAAVNAYADGRQAPVLVASCPASTEFSQLAGDELREWEAALRASLSTKVAWLSSADIARSGFAAHELPILHSLAAVPYSDEGFAILAGALARKLHSLLEPPYKVVAVDCDQTLWDGVCAEDGVSGVRVEPRHVQLQEYLLEKQREGVLLCLVSKNREEDVLEVLRDHPEMILRPEHFVAWRINWEAKADNLRTLAAELGLSLDTFLFLDDNPLECASVASDLPQVLTVNLPSQSPAMDILGRIWALDGSRRTEEDSKRTSMYRDGIARSALERAAPTFDAFLAGLELRITIASAGQDQLARVAQLMERTTQFNASGIRRSVTELERSAEQGDDLLQVDVSDRFGDYGLVGAMVCRNSGETLVVETFLLSCRALGRGVEARMLCRLGEMAEERSLPWVAISFRPTSRNSPVRRFLERSGGEFEAGADGAGQYRFRPQVARNCPVLAVDTTETELDRPAAEAAGNGSTRALRLARAAELEAAPAEVVRLAYGPRRERPDLPSSFLAPRTPSEHRVAAIWREVLRVEQVGIDDAFHALGGRSLHAMRVLSRIRETWRPDLDPTTLFRHANIRSLAAFLDSMDAAAHSASHKEVARAGDQQRGFARLQKRRSPQAAQIL
ncbi:MAG: HAD-IIIC family phosphatase [Bryobacteraceae bacterium]|nr:HAD-IIIC family phosphatase [Bryobacteraceae bacterium]